MYAFMAGSPFKDSKGDYGIRGQPNKDNV